MKNKYFLYFSLMIFLIFSIGLYFIDIPAPSTTVIEKYTINLK